MSNAYDRGITIDEFLVSDYVDDISNELHFWVDSFDIGDIDSNGYNRDKSVVRICIDIGSHLDLDEIQEYLDLMKKIDDKFGKNTACLNASDKEPDAMYIIFDAPLKGILG